MLKVYILARTIPSSPQSLLSTNVAVTVKTVGAKGPYCNCKEVKETFPYLDNAFERFKEAHCDYVGEILDENTITEGQRYLEDKEKKVCVFHVYRSLDFEVSNMETLYVKKTSRSGHLSTVNAISN